MPSSAAEKILGTSPNQDQPELDKPGDEKDRTALREGYEMREGIRRLVGLFSATSLGRNLRSEDASFRQQNRAMDKFFLGKNFDDSIKYQGEDNDMEMVAARDIIINARPDSPPSPVEETPTPKEKEESVETVSSSFPPATASGQATESKASEPKASGPQVIEKIIEKPVLIEGPTLPTWAKAALVSWAVGAPFIGTAIGVWAASSSQPEVPVIQEEPVVTEPQPRTKYGFTIEPGV
jgi:hypothetical protein